MKRPASATTATTIGEKMAFTLLCRPAARSDVDFEDPGPTGVRRIPHTNQHTRSSRRLRERQRDIVCSRSDSRRKAFLPSFQMSRPAVCPLQPPAAVSWMAITAEHDSHPDHPDPANFATRPRRRKKRVGGR
jgi:hypothetical protein